MKKYHYVYKIINTINNKYYIGKRSCNCEIENDRYLGSGNLIKAAIKKYGTSNFNKEILAVCCNEMLAYKIESVFCNQNTLNDPLCYNQKVGGFGAPMTDETKKKLSDIRKGNKPHNWSDEARLNLSKAKKGKPGKVWTDESKLKLSKSRIGVDVSTEYSRRRSSETHKGKTLTEEHKLKCSVALKGRILTEDHKNNMSISCKNKKHIYVYDREYKEYIFDSITEAGKYFNIERTTINRKIEDYNRVVQSKFIFTIDKLLIDQLKLQFEDYDLKQKFMFKDDITIKVYNSKINEMLNDGYKFGTSKIIRDKQSYSHRNGV